MEYAWGYYDALLVAIALSLVLGVVLGALTPLPFPVSIAVFSGLAAAIVGHGLFVNGPVDAPVEPTELVPA